MESFPEIACRLEEAQKIERGQFRASIYLPQNLTADLLPDKMTAV